MAIVTKRNAFIGWVTVKFGKKYGTRVGKILVHDQTDKLTRKMRFRSKR
jgi:hypothetical protein